MSRRLAREVALRSLFQVEVGRSEVEEALAYNASELGLEVPDQAFAATLCRGALMHRPEIDRIIEEYALGWRIERMPYVDRNILRMALYELIYEEETPASVAVNEAVELAKLYGDTNSPRFINGILGSFVRERIKGEKPPEPTKA